mmetsp:Transcript_1276/g.3066  ORF Transcript_1276/g.3066 Transcript_1276/m.3066 type:complete len:94 (+) Transcript_1276:212-493(+)
MPDTNAKRLPQGIKHSMGPEAMFGCAGLIPSSTPLGPTSSGSEVSQANPPLFPQIHDIPNGKKLRLLQLPTYCCPAAACFFLAATSFMRKNLL